MKIGFISDIHEDLPGLQRALSILEKKGCTEIICLGDIAGYSFPYFKYDEQRDASACLDLVRNTCSLVLPGNHDLYASRKIPEAKSDFIYPSGWYDLDFKVRQEQAAGKIWLYEDSELESNLSDDDKNYLSGLPEFIVRDTEGIRIMLSHYLYPDLTGSSTRFLPDDSLIRSHLNFMNEHGCELSFFGHCHVDGLWCIRDEYSCIKKSIRIKKKKKALLGFGMPCIANGSIEPGIVVYDTKTGLIKNFSLYSSIKRLLKQ